MRWIRIYIDQALQEGAEIELEDLAARHLSQVLRLRVGDRFSAFNGDGFDYPAQLTSVRKQQVTAHLLGARQARARPSVPFILGQALIKGERMDWAIQKAVELGVAVIAPLTSERTEVRLSGERVDKRLQHWQGVAISACEQCGRADVPEILLPQAWHVWADQVDATQKLALIPEAQQSLGDLTLTPTSIAIAIGPEGGWSEVEVAAWGSKGFRGVSLGQRILRAETAGLAVLASLQTIVGDFK